MARLFLVNPPTDELVRTPLLSFLYLASALRRAGHEVAVLDASAPFAPRGHDEVVERALSFRAEAVGIHCKTLYAQDAYALAASFAGRGVQLVCGGPHPTVAPLEPLAHGFDFSVRGEGEETLAELCDAFDGRRPLGSVDPRAAAALPAISLGVVARGGEARLRRRRRARAQLFPPLCGAPRIDLRRPAPQNRRDLSEDRRRVRISAGLGAAQARRDRNPCRWFSIETQRAKPV
jgi:radical SAM superfamily enzyme YgiQ (UPF0313 family)